MNIRDRVKEAYENVAFCADKTWLRNDNYFQKTNLELYLTEIHLEKTQLKKIRPRTVREWIPKSHLAQYSNYEYNESREMSYAPSNSNPLFECYALLPTEPWEMPEVTSLFRWFLSNSPNDHLARLDDLRYESPFLNVNGFEDRILKAQLTEAKVKNIWNRNDRDHLKSFPESFEITAMIFLSSLDNFFVIIQPKIDTKWFRKISVSNDLEQIQKLSKQLKEQNEMITKRKRICENSASVAEPVSTEILYSEVLQGLLQIKKQNFNKAETENNQCYGNITNDEDLWLSPEHIATSIPPNNQLNLISNNNLKVDTASSSSMSQTNFSLLQQTQQQKSSTNDIYPTFNKNLQPQFYNYLDQFMLNSNIYNNNNNNLQFNNIQDNRNNLIQDNNYLQTVSRWRCTQQNQYLSITRQNRVPIMQPITTSYVQQAYFYSPLLSCQRWIPGFSNSTQQTRFINAPVWFNPNTSNLITDANQCLRHSEVHVAKYNNAKKTLEETWNSTGFINIYNNNNSCNNTKQEYNVDCETKDNMNLLNVCENSFHEELEAISFFEDHQVTTSVSEELEIQALKQYNNYESDESFYQELELQAKEQYGNSFD